MLAVRCPIYGASHTQTTQDFIWRFSSVEKLILMCHKNQTKELLCAELVHPSVYYLSLSNYVILTILPSQVDHNSICYRISPDSPDDFVMHAEKNIYDVMKNNHVQHNLMWQYFGSEDGIFTTYPAHQSPCREYDPRFR